MVLLTSPRKPVAVVTIAPPFKERIKEIPSAGKAIEASLEISRAEMHELFQASLSSSLILCRVSNLPVFPETSGGDTMRK